jgi:hypothetical protein
MALGTESSVTYESFFPVLSRWFPDIPAEFQEFSVEILNSLVAWIQEATGSEIINFLTWLIEMSSTQFKRLVSVVMETNNCEEPRIPRYQDSNGQILTEFCWFLLKNCSKITWMSSFLNFPDFYVIKIFSEFS